MTSPIKITTPRDPSEAILSDGCAWCCDTPAVGEYGGDVLCARCADEWTAEQEALDEIERVEEWAQENMRTAGVYRGAMIEARLSDARQAYLSTLDKGLRDFHRNERGGRV
jgi:uncharacterized Zn finger protein (UPF0148 family)